jgi:hypothetical protein
MRSLVRRLFQRKHPFPTTKFDAQYAADGTAVNNKNYDFLHDPAFDAAWRRISSENNPYWPGGTPDVRWRMHVCVWAAKHALKVEGDFVECGVNTGLFPSMICALTPLAASGKRLLLFDTWSGIPVESLPDAEHWSAQNWNKALYNFDSYPVAQKIFAPYPNVQFVRGVLPDSLDQVDIQSIAYLGMDLNIASAELSSAERLWPKLSPGAMVVLDDYAFHGHDPQYKGWNAFAAARGLAVLTLPTGQGLICIPPRPAASRT